MMLTYEIFEDNKVRVYGGGVNVIYYANRFGEKFQSYADAESFALGKIAEINRDRAGIQNVYLHVALSGGDGRKDPIGVENNGIEKLHANCTVRAGEATDSAIIDAIPDKSWRILLRHNDGSEYETINVSMVSGVIAFDYYTKNIKTGLVYVDESALDEIFEIGGYKYRIKLVGDTEFKVYRNL
jgi:hypothetical protein